MLPSCRSGAESKPDILRGSILRLSGEAWAEVCADAGKTGRREGSLPRGTIQTPPLLSANWLTSMPVAPTSTITLPEWTKNTICILRLFLARLKPSGGSSTMPAPKNGIVMILAYLKSLPATSRVTIDAAANPRSIRSVSHVCLSVTGKELKTHLLVWDHWGRPSSFLGSNSRRCQ